MVALPPHLDVYYSWTCAPCRLELPALAAAATQGADIRILIVSEEARARADLATISTPLAHTARLAPGNSARARLRQAGDDDGILPFTRAARADGSLCGSWRGILTPGRMLSLLRACRSR
jgi:hypothetical protein